MKKRTTMETISLSTADIRALARQDGITVAGYVAKLQRLKREDAEKSLTCHKCGARVPIAGYMAEIGARGRGAAKLRTIDYAALARKSHAARRKNSADADAD